MIIVCSNCQKNHNIDESKIPDQPVRIKCKTCGHSFRFDKSSPESDDKPGGPKPVVRRIGVCLSKGGVGKTTTAVNVAAGLSLAGYRVLLIDTDTQGQSAYMLGVKPVGGLAELLTKELSLDEALFKARENLWILAGGKSLAGVKRLINRKDFGGELTLSESLSEIDADYDYVVVDTSPGWDPLTVNVLFYVRELLLPVSLEVMSLQALGSFFKSVASIKKYRSELKIKYIVPNFMDLRVRKKSETILEKLEALYKDTVCAPIRYNNVLSQAPMYGKTIFEYAPGAKGALDYKELVRKITGQQDLFQ